ncbi:MAG: acetyl-CoA C-acyltransferase [Bacteroidetes bacterium]|nr:acetyl-CoA C-acyltransferase [Bacteroidota bacterium]
MENLRKVYIVAAVRTPIGSFGGSISSLTATDLGAIAIKSSLQKAGVKPEDVGEVFMGNVLSSNLGQAPARQASLASGIPNTTPCTTINKVCASGMKAIMLGAQSIMLGDNDVVVSGGMESMSNVPYYLDQSRYGYKYGHGTVIDGVIKDGLWDVYNDYHMGSAAELCATEKNISREDQDNYAIESYKRAAKAYEENFMKDEIVDVEIPQKKGDPVIVNEDEEYKKVIFEKVPNLKPVFDKEGTVTAANASTINDGASALVLMSEEKVKESGVKPMSRILSFADAAQAPEWFTTAPAKAIPKALDKAGLKIEDVDYFEINEAFAVVAIVNNNELKLDPAKVNIYGGAVALGHPLGSSGSRIIVTLNSVLKNNDAKIGVAGICNGGGGASAMVIERVTD